MPPALERLAESGIVFAAVLLGAAAVFVGLFLAWRRLSDPAEKERRRRLRVNRHGRTTSGVVMDIADEDAAARLLHYTYKIGAVEYNACQDVTTLAELVGEDPSRIVGPVQVKYQRANPYNSIVVCEDWNGLRSKRG